MRKMKHSGLPWIQEIPDSWSLTKIKYIAEVVPGATPKSSVPEYWDGEIPFITPADYVTEDHYISYGSRSITTDGMNSCSTSLLPIGSIIVSTRAPIGPVVINSIPICTNQGCKGLVQRSKFFNFEYLYRLLSIAEDALIALGNGTTYQELSGRSLANFKIPKPSLQEQNAIVSYIVARCAPIDEAISRHRQAIDKLEEYRRAVVVKAVTKGLDSGVPMKDSGVTWIGMIPTSWDVQRIKFVASLASGGTPSRDHQDYWDGNIPWVTTGDLNGGEVTLTAEKITQLGLENSSAKIFSTGTVLVAMYGGAGTIGKCGILVGDFAINQALCAIRCRSSLDPYYLLYQMHAIRPYWMRHAAGTRKDPNISQALISNERIVVPPYEEQLKIVSELNSICADIDDSIKRQNDIISKLEEYRRSLIHAAVTGRIDCKKEPL